MTAQSRSDGTGADQDPAGWLTAAGQGHLVEHARSLGAQGAGFLATAARWPWQQLKAAALEPAPSPVRELRPPQGLTWRRQQGEGALRDRLARLGVSLLTHGRVATLLLAGGQGTRLGHAGPKGTVVFGPEAERTLYRIHAERVAAARTRFQQPFPFFLLLSPQTAEATRAEFARCDQYGLGAAAPRPLLQGVLPCLDPEGRALLEAPGMLATAPDGHGGALEALAEAGVLEELVERGVDVLTTYQVDNPLARPFDPVLLGWMLERRAQIVTKVVRKRDPAEPVGLVVRDVAGRHRIVEYSEVDPEEAAPLPYGSIALHAFSTRWLRDLWQRGVRLPLHRARKRVRALAPDGSTREVQAIKLERFLFDVFPHAERVEFHEVPREWEFAPVKNATGADSLVSARLLVETEVLRWHRLRGLPEPTNPVLRPLELDGAEAHS